jgi:MazG family protein
MTAGDEFDRLVEIMHRLRASCPWDRAQTHESLRSYLLEEAYELLQAIDEGGPERVREELGDLMLQIVFHAEIAGEGGHFDIADVLRAINEKLVRRHPHVFAEARADTADDVIDNWESIKRDEKQCRPALGGVPDQLPALLKASRILSKMRHNGADPFSAREALSDALAWLGRLQSAVEQGDAEGAERAIGMLILAAAASAARVGVSAEDALRTSLARLAGAFEREEARLRERGRTFRELDDEELAAISARLLADCEGR